VNPPEPANAQPEPAELTVDATGLRCPLPIIRLAAVARTASAGTVITLLSTDPAAEPDVAAWCRMRGQLLLDQTWVDAVPARILTSRISVTATPGKATPP
jgi:tRNA 2-thiouridine synthesizing protein A